ncbi:MAG: hypothetical protein ACR2MP_33885 [Streptosporangiaceae bacterium]
MTRVRPVTPWEKAVSELAGWLAGQLPGLVEDRARVLVEQATGHGGRHARTLLEYVRERPRALADPAPLLPPSAVRLAHALHREGYRQVVLPRCARCAKTPGRLKTPRPEGRICYQCVQRERRKACVRCGRDQPVHIRTAAGPVCSTCHSRPAHQCEGCGQLRPLARRAGSDGPALCVSCHHPPDRVCVSCGRLRPCYRRRADGNTYCRTCYPLSPRDCARCGRRRFVAAEWPIGPVCDTCYTHVRRNPAPCIGGGRFAVLVAADPGGQPVCGPCAGWAGQAFTCTGCGAPDMLEHGRCTRCVLAAVTGGLLAAAAPEVHGQLTQLTAALLAARQPQSALRWLRRSGGGQLLTSLVAGREPITHALLDQMPPSPELHHLRDRLVVTGILAERREYLDRIPAWTSQLVTGKPADHARMIRAYAQWDALRRARRTTRPTPGQAQAVRTKIRTASAFLDWLATRNSQLATLTQPDLDAWITSHRRDECATLRPFLSWAQQRHLRDRELAIPGRPSTEPDIQLDGDQRWQQLHTCLTDDTFPLAARASGAVALLYGAALSHILLLRLSDLATLSGRCHLRLGEHPVLVPPAIARLLIEQAATAATQPGAPKASPWLFPGQSGLHPVTPARTVAHLNSRGIQVRAGRTAALIDLAGQLPPAVLASLLGLAPSTADRWSRRIASDWAAYLHARANSLRK